MAHSKRRKSLEWRKRLGSLRKQTTLGTKNTQMNIIYFIILFHTDLLKLTVLVCTLPHNYHYFPLIERREKETLKGGLRC
jgi:hypothetical protein